MVHRRLTKNPTLLSLLKAGCRVELPCLFVLAGDPDNGYIKMFSEGYRHLSPDGLAAALNDADTYDRQRRRTEPA